jgi:hypothetical protein
VGQRGRLIPCRKTYPCEGRKGDFAAAAFGRRRKIPFRERGKNFCVRPCGKWPIPLLFL